jgi:subtilisin family serine protease
MKSYSKVIVLIVIGLIIWSYSSAQNVKQVEYAKGEVLIAFKQNISDSQILQTLDKYNLEIITAYSIVPNAYLVRQKGLATRTVAKKEERDVVQTLVANLELERNVLISEPNYKVHAIKASNDYGLECLWAFNNIGQTGGTVDADIDAFEAWDLTTGSSAVIVGIIDSGIDYDHPDLADNMWKNPGEIPHNNIDDDNNGYVDDIYGWDWAYNDNNPGDYCGHGTHCAGTVSAVGDNGEGVAGVCWNVKLMALKFLDDLGYGYDSDAILAIEYATNMGATLTSNSWGGYDYSAMLEAAIDSSNMLFIAAVGNDDMDTDIISHYPSGYNLDNIIAVAATDHNDDRAYFSNYGATSVDLGAPGVDILSTKPDNPTDISFDPPGCGLSSVYYGVISGTSMATPHVSGTAALLHSWNPSLTWAEVKAAILDNVDPVTSLSGITVTGGRLNAYNALISVQSGIIVSSDSLNFGIVGIGKTETLKLEITNATGSDVTVHLSSDNDVFSSAVSSVFLTNGSSDLVDIYFSPIAQQTYDAILTCDTGDTVVYVNMIGIGDYLPFIEVAPDKLYFELSSNDSSTQELTISNTGMADLTWNISGILGMKSKMNQYAASYYRAIPKGAPDTRIGNVVTSSSGGPDTYGYTWIDSDVEEGLKFDWIDISSTGIPVTGLSDDNFAGPFPIGFPFNYYGTEYKEFYIASNGYIGFGPTDNYNNQNNYPLPHPNKPNNLLAWCWDDLDPKTGSIFYEKVDNELVIQFIDYGEFGADGTVNAEIILNRNGAITFQYLNFQNGFDVLHSTVGIENSDGTDGLEVVFNNSYLHDSLAVQFSTNQWLSVTPQSGAIQPGNSEKINVSANSSGLNAGTYKTYLAINNNDLDNNPANVPITMTVEAQNVTFSVNMSIYESVGYFNPGVGDYVTIPGTFNDWTDSTAYKLSDTGGGIYEGTFPFYGNVGDTLEYKYYIHAGDGRSLPNGGWEDSVGVYGGTEGNRGFVLTGGDQRLATVYFNNNDIGFPAIRITPPDSFVVELIEGDSTEEELTIINEGVTDLSWEILITNSAKTDNGNLSTLAQLFTTKERPLNHEDSLSLYLFPKHEYITRIPAKINLNSDPIIFFDDFESGNYDQWIPTGGSYIREVTSETAANGKYSFKQNGSGEHFSGVYTSFDRSTPSTVSFYVSPTSYYSAHCYFVLGDDDILNNAGIAFFYAYNGNFRLYASSQVISEVPYNINEWYHIELCNIDYVNKRFDYYINSQLIVANFPFRAQESSCISNIYLYNWRTDAIAFYDVIAVGSSPVKSWLTVTPDSGVVSPQGNQKVKVALNAVDLPPGNYSKNLVINSDAPINPVLNLPVKLAVLMRNPPDISVTPDSFAVELAEGDSTIELLKIENKGVGELNWEIGLTNPEMKKNVYKLSPPLQKATPSPDIVSSSRTMPIRKTELKAELEDLTGVKILWDISHGQGSYYYWSIIINDLKSRGATVEENSNPITPTLLNDCDVFWTRELDYNFTSSEINAIKDWLNDGGAILLEGDETPGITIFNTLLKSLGAGIVYSSISGTDGITTNIYPHYMTTNVKQILIPGTYAHLSSVTSPAEVLIEDKSKVPNTAYSRVGKGRILAMADEMFSDNAISSADNQLFANQAFDWLAKGGAVWLTFTPQSGSIIPNDYHEVKLKINAVDLSLGQYEDTLYVKSNDPDERVIDVPVKLTVVMPNPPKIEVTPDSLNVELTKGDSITKKLQISNTGSGNLNWSIEITANDSIPNKQNKALLTTIPNAAKINSNGVQWSTVTNWLSVTPDSGTVIPQDSQQVSISINTSELTADVYTANFKITSNDPYKQILYVPVNLTVLPPPEITVTPDSFNVELTEGDSVTHQLYIANSGIGNLNWFIDIGYGNTFLKQKKTFYSTTHLYNQYKHLAGYKDCSDINNQGSAKIGPIPMSALNLLNGSTQILAWTTYADMNEEYANTLNAISQYYTDYTVTTTTVTDSAALASELAGKNIFLIPEQENGSSSEYVSLGSSWRAILNKFVSNGGTVILCGSSKGTEQILRSSGLMYLSYYDTDNPSAMTVLDTTHFVTRGLPASIPSQNATMFYNIYDQQADILVTYKNYAAVAAKNIGYGHVVLVGYDFYSYDDNAAKIISNAVKWAAIGNWLSVTPNSGTVTYLDSQLVDLNFNTSEVVAGIYKANLAIHSNDVENPVVNVPVNLKVLTAAPPIITINVDSFAVELAEGDSSFRTLTIRNSGKGKLVYNIDIGIYSPSSLKGDGRRGEETDSALLIPNTFISGIGQDWLHVCDPEGTIQGDNSIKINILFDANSLLCGTYRNHFIRINHNDNKMIPIIIPIVLKVNSATTDISDVSATEIPEYFDLSQNYPNPFNPVTNIMYQLPNASYVTLKIYDLLGREVITLVDKQQKAGYYNIQWNGKTNCGANVPSGVYFYLIKTDKYEKTRKMLLMK